MCRAIQFVPIIYRIVLGTILAANEACIHTMWRMPHRRIIHFKGANTRGMQPRRNAKRWFFVLYIVGKQVISELEDHTSNQICRWHPKEVGGTDCTIISGNKKLVCTNRAPKQLTTSIAKGIEQWRVQNIQYSRTDFKEMGDGTLCFPRKSSFLAAPTTPGYRGCEALACCFSGVSPCPPTIPLSRCASGVFLAPPV